MECYLNCDEVLHTELLIKEICLNYQRSFLKIPYTKFNWTFFTSTNEVNLRIILKEVSKYYSQIFLF